MAPQVHNGIAFEEVLTGAGNTAAESPVQPAADGDGSIFIAIPTFRDGKRCAETIRSIFENAKDPDKVIIGVIEQNSPEDDFCLSVYCDHYGVKTINKRVIRDDVTKIMVVEGREEKCPRFKQIRYLAFFNIAANGPSGARALTRKILGNEEYCMQIDAHTTFVPSWDEIAKTEWKNAKNEFAIISTAPANLAEMSDYESWTGAKNGQVPRQCLVRFADNEIPEYAIPADGKATGLEVPLLSHTWSSAFSFSKCHIEETAPYDPFTQYVFGAEQFARFARFWTRGYDVYTPTKNIVYHDYIHSEHDMKEWFKQRRERIRNQSLQRVKIFLGIATPEGINIEAAQANMGIYGLGKRRTLKQLQDFLGIDLVKRKGYDGHTNCANKVWVPYDSSISPIENIYDKATDLDPQPEFPLRTEFNFFVEQEPEPDKYMVVDGDPMPEQQALPVVNQPISNNSPSFSMLLILWVFGLIVWCMLFVNNGRSSRPLRKRQTKKAGGEKDV